jgi:hypothetical protein
MRELLVALLIASLCGCTVQLQPNPQASPLPEYPPVQINLAQQASAVRDTVVVRKGKKTGLVRKAVTVGVLVLAAYGGKKLGQKNLKWQRNAAGGKVFPYVKRK